jgi:peptidoglycan/LPS O-acetylase OafA/YrhL
MAPKKYFENLDGFRFVLAMIVFASHARLGEALIKVSSIDFVNRLILTFSKGYLGVSSFFVLSGFLITYLMIEEKDHQLEFNLKNFYVRRSLRIWPLYYSVLIFTFFIYPIAKTVLRLKDQNPFDLLYQVFFLANFDSIRVQHAGLVGVAPLMININWSVSIEEQFYFVWPLLFLLFRPTKFWIGCLSIVLASWIFRAFTFDSADLYYHTLSVVSDLGIGAFFACLCYYNSGFVKIIEQANRGIITFIYLSGILILMYSDLLFSNYFNQSSSRIINALFFIFIILEQSYAKHSLFKFSNFKLISSLSKYTYGLYMLHPIGVQVSIIAFRFLSIQREQNFFHAILYSLLAFAVSIILAITGYCLIEQKFLKMRKKFS